MEKDRNPTTRQYVGLVRDLDSRMAQMPLLFNDNQQLDESKLMNSIVNKVPRSYKAMIILQGYNPEMGDLANFIEHCEQAETTDNIAVVKVSASY